MRHCAQKFPAFQIEVEHRRAESSSTFYYAEEFNNTGATKTYPLISTHPWFVFHMRRST